MKTLDLLMRLYYAVLDPLIVRRRQAARLRRWGESPASLTLSLEAGRAQGAGSAQALARMRRVARSYDMLGHGRGATPTMLDLMGHRDHLANGVMLLMHVYIAQWLLRAETPAARGARAIWYGALEHGGEGLLTWKRRAGFAPVRVRLLDQAHKG